MTMLSQVNIREPALRGGEGEAMRKLKGFLAEAAALSPKPGAGVCPEPTTTVTVIVIPVPVLRRACWGRASRARSRPWLAMGCLSPRRMFEEMRKVLPSTSCAGADAGTATGVSLDWLVFELLWRDFFRKPEHYCTLQ